MGKLLCMFTFFCKLIYLASANEYTQEYIYIVKKGDELGTILYSMGFQPLWHKENFVEKTVKRNPATIKKNGDLIYPEDKLLIPEPPLFTCNVSIQDKEIQIISKIKSKKDYLKQRESFSSNCNQTLPPLKKNQYKRFADLSLSSRLSFSKVSITDVLDGSSTDIYSKANYGLRLAWTQHWSQNFFSSYFIDVDRYSYQAPPNRSIEKDSLNLINAGLQGQYNLIGITYLAGQLRYGEELYLHAKDTSSISLVQGNALKGQLGLGLKASSFELFQMSAEIGITVLNGATVNGYSSDTKLGSYAQVRMTQDYKKNTFFGEIMYARQPKDTEHFEQVHSSINFNFGVSWDLFQK